MAYHKTLLVLEVLHHLLHEVKRLGVVTEVVLFVPLVVVLFLVVLFFLLREWPLLVLVLLVVHHLLALLWELLVLLVWMELLI